MEYSMETVVIPNLHLNLHVLDAHTLELYPIIAWRITGYDTPEAICAPQVSFNGNQIVDGNHFDK